MNMQRDTAKPDIFAQAEYWFVRLRAENCSPQERMAFRQWQGDPACAEAYAVTEALWEEVGEAETHPEIERLSQEVLAETAPSSRTTNNEQPTTKWAFRPIALAASVAAIAVALGSALFLYDPNAYTTGLGEQQTVTLDDGSTVILNTETRIETDFTEDSRQITLVRGEALFDVRKDRQRPFLVAAGNSWVRALGTRFQIRRDRDRTEVTLLEGRVRVEKTASSQSPASNETLLLPSRERAGERGSRTTSEHAFPAMPEPILLEPGERVALADNREEIVRSRIEDRQAVLSWTNGRLIFRATPLEEAVAEVNRYARTKIRIGDPRIADLSISGTFVTGDSEILAAALEADFPVQAERTGRREIVLYRQARGG